MYYLIMKIYLHKIIIIIIIPCHGKGVDVLVGENPALPSESADPPWSLRRFPPHPTTKKKKVANILALSFF